MKTLTVVAEKRRYPILIGAGAVERLAPWLERRGLPSSINVISDETVERRHGARLRSCLGGFKVPLRRLVVPAGEGSKSVRQLGRLWRELVRSGVDRKALVIALGGGVVGDLAGFVAASTLRGIGLVQVPTTLLAMVDSSVGGKTGINLPEGKNLVGAFHAPEAVFIDPDFLRTLPVREIRAGWAEIIKAAAIRDPRLFALLERCCGDLSGRARDESRLESVIRTACRIKAEVVSADETEAGLRMILNFGHTLGHGVEAAAGYGRLLHGEAVAVGMVFAARLAHALGLASPGTAERIESLVGAFGLPRRVPAAAGVQASRVLGSMRRDKKVGPAGPRWVFVPRIGSARVHDDVPWESVEAAATTFLSGRRGRARGSS